MPRKKRAQEVEVEREPTRRAWWLSTRRRRTEWQELVGAGTAVFTGRPRSHFEAAMPGDPVLLYVSRGDHSIRAVGVISRGVPAAGTSSGQGQVEPQIEVQLAFELANPLPWQEIASAPELKAAEPVRQRSSGTLFRLEDVEYNVLRGLIVARNPEHEASFAALESGVPPEGPEEEARVVREAPASYDVPPNDLHLPQVRNLNELHELTLLPCDLLEEARDMLEDTGQIVLSGPPGTGKTWLARGLGSLVAGDPSRLRVTQFHPSTSYEDFIEGLKPVVDNWGQVSYAVMPGLFVRLCQQARGDPQHYYVLVIDEINRAPLARVFGELLYALEYRGPQGAVQLSPSGSSENPDPFYVPDNLLVIATMNSADRSLAVVDYALRRRFRFIELEPSGEALDAWLARHGTPPAPRKIVLDLFALVNGRLSNDLDPDHRLGHSYFMLDPLDATGLDRLWRTAVKPLIAEYFIPPSGEVEEYGTLFAEAVDALRQI